jgi:hypothetical protein
MVAVQPTPHPCSVPSLACGKEAGRTGGQKGFSSGQVAADRVSFSNRVGQLEVACVEVCRE